MKDEAAANAEADKKETERITKLNQAEQPHLPDGKAAEGIR